MTGSSQFKTPIFPAPVDLSNSGTRVKVIAVPFLSASTCSVLRAASDTASTMSEKYSMRLPFIAVMRSPVCKPASAALKGLSG